MVNEKQAASRPGIFGTLVRKFFMDVAKSPGLLACCLFPPLFLLVFRLVVIDPVAHEDAPLFLLATGMLFSTAMVPGTTTVYPMAEAREKRTLRTLELAGVGRVRWSPRTASSARCGPRSWEPSASWCRAQPSTACSPSC